MKQMPIHAILTLVLAGGLLSSCSSQPLTPESKSVTASRKKPNSDCEFISKVSGTTNSAHAKPEDALEDMKKDTANKGGNYVLVEQYSPYGTAVSGQAYKCP